MDLNYKLITNFSMRGSVNDCEQENLRYVYQSWNAEHRIPDRYVHAVDEIQ